MVDFGAAISSRPMTSRRAEIEGDRAAALVEVRPADDIALADYEAFCRAATLAPPQHPIWIRAWIMATGADAIVVSLSRAGRASHYLVLEVVTRGPNRIARFPGGKHANGNFVATSPGAAQVTQQEWRFLVAGIRRARPDIDLIQLERQNPHGDGVPNPLALQATLQSPNVSLAVDLEGGFAAVLARQGGKRKRKKYNAQLRKFGEEGGFRLIEARTAEEVDRLIEEFFIMKAARLGEAGIANTFAAPQVQAFFRMLFREAAELQYQPFRLHGLEVAGEIRAVNGLSFTNHSMVCEFGSIRETASKASPGYLLDYCEIEQACEEKMKLFDLSVGDEPYKRSWCDVETWQFDVLQPLTAKGHVAVFYERARARTVGFVKSNRTIWSLVKMARARMAGKPQPADAG